jgi:hypothetical protein
MRQNTISWNFYGEDIRDYSRIETSLAKAARSGFRGIQVQLRDYRYQIDQSEVIEAMRHARSVAHRLGLQFWLHLDLRDAVASFLTQHPGLRQRVLVPVEAALGEDEYRLSLDHSLVTSDHKQHCSYDFEAIERVFAFRVEKKVQVAEEIACRLFADTGYINWQDRRGQLEVIDSSSVVDITNSVTPFPDKRVLSLSGRWRQPAPGDWRVIAFARLCMNTFDYSTTEATLFQRHLVDLYREALGSDLDALFCDEPGHPCAYHYLTPRNGYFVGNQFYATFESSRGYDLRDRLYALIYDTSDGRAGKVRFDYYTSWANAIYRFQKDLKEHARSRFGSGVQVGIHCTASEWSAGDLQKGTLDYWKMVETTTAGYADGKHHDRYNAFFHVTLAKSLAKLSDSKNGYAQTWDLFPSASSEDYWSNVAATYGVRWSPLGWEERYSAYAASAGATGAMEERSRNTARINAKMARLDDLTGGTVAESNLLAVFPLETIIRLGNEEANNLRRVCHLLAYHLQSAHYQTDFVSPEVLARGKVADGKLLIGGRRYDAVVYPFPGCLPRSAFDRLKQLYSGGGKLLLYGCPPSETPEGDNLTAEFARWLGIRPVTRMHDYIEPDPTTPYTATVSFVRELAGVPTVNLREGMFLHAPWHHYFWPIVPDSGSAVAVNLRWTPDPLWIGCLRENAACGQLLFLGFDCGCVADADRLLDRLLTFLQVPKLVDAPRGLWSGLVRHGENQVVLCCNRDGGEPFSANLKALGHTVEAVGVDQVLATVFGADDQLLEVVASPASRVTVDGMKMKVAP